MNRVEWTAAATATIANSDECVHAVICTPIAQRITDWIIELLRRPSEHTSAYV